MKPTLHFIAHTVKWTVLSLYMVWVGLSVHETAARARAIDLAMFNIAADISALNARSRARRDIEMPFDYNKRIERELEDRQTVIKTTPVPSALAWANEILRDGSWSTPIDELRLAKQIKTSWKLENCPACGNINTAECIYTQCGGSGKAWVYYPRPNP